MLLSPVLPADDDVLGQEVERRSWRADPVRLMGLMTGLDQRDGTRFSLAHLREPLEPGEVVLEGNALRRQDASWRWQRFVAEWVLRERRSIMLKGRQIGVTWIVLAADVAECLLTPGTSSLLFRQREDEAIDNVRRWWILFRSLPGWARDHVEVVKPSAAPQPGRDGVVLRFGDGSLSEVVPMTSAAASGHGRSVRRVILDEAAWIEKLSDIRAAIEPAAGRAFVSIVSTAHGRSNLETGEGNEFHRVWATAEESGYSRLFLPFDVHPERDDEWFESAPEVRSLRVHQRQEQFPRNEHEAFWLSSNTFFDPDALVAYRERVASPLERFSFVREGPRSARRARLSDGLIQVFARPDRERTYAIGVDCATSRGRDFSAAFVVCLQSMELVAELHGRLDSDLLAEQLHYLGRWFGRQSGCVSDALVGVETQGGYGDAVIASLRDGTAGRPAYARLERNELSSRPDLPEAKPFGLPMGAKMRPLVLSNLERAIRDGDLPWVSNDLLHEMENFLVFDVGVSPRAADGAKDDRVMAAAIVLELYRRHGYHEHRPRLRSRSRQRQPYPWLKPPSARGKRRVRRPKGFSSFDS